MARPAARLASALLCLLMVAAAGAQNDQALFPESNKGLKPEKLVTFGTTHYYQMAENAVGTVIFFHGCSRSARNFFPYDPENCPECLGFGEHLSHTKQALARGYNVLSLDPQDDKNFCWSSANRGPYTNDQPQAIATIRFFILKNNLEALPIFFWGASSGGTLALKLLGQLYRNDVHANELAKETGLEPAYTLWGSVSGMIAEAATPTDFDASDSQGNLLYPGFPPTIFVRMQRDGAEQDVETNLAFFRRNDVRSDVIISPVRRMGPLYFSNRIPTITEEQSQLIIEALKEIGMLSETGWLLGDPKDDDDPKSPAFRWTTKLQTMLPMLSNMSKSLSLVLKFSPIQQAMMVAYAKHDAVSDYFTACLAWLESGGRANASELAQQMIRRRLSSLTAGRL